MKRKIAPPFKCLLWTVAALMTLFGFWILSTNYRVLHRGGAHILNEMPRENSYDAILILGAGLKEDGTPSHMLEDRLRYGVELYRRGVAPRLILSGDRSGEHYDEVGAMARFCLALGVPEESLIYDTTGFSTFESIDNFKEKGEGSILIVTQKYHLYRALYIAGELGIEADGYPSDPRAYRNQWYRELREVVARWKDVLKVSQFS